MAKTLNIQIEISDDIHNQFVKYCKNNKIYRGRAYVELLESGLKKESFAEYLLNKFDCITSIEMAKNIAENVFEFGSPARDVVETLAQNYKESKKD